MGSGLSFWIFLLSLFPNPIIEDGKLGFIDRSGEILIKPDYYAPIHREPLLLDYFISINEGLLRGMNSFAFNESSMGLVACINENSDSLILQGKNREILDAFSLEEDTIQMYYYLDKKNETIRQIIPLINIQSVLEIENFNQLTINVGLKNNKNEVVIPTLLKATGLKEYFMANGNVKLLGDNLIFSSKRVLDLKGNTIMEAERVSFSGDMKYIVCYSEDQRAVINLKGELIVPLQEGHINSINEAMFNINYSRTSQPSLLMNIEGDTLLNDFIHVFGGANQLYKEQVFTVVFSKENRYTRLKDDKYGFINNIGEWIIPPKKRDSLSVNIDHTPQKNLFVVKYFDQILSKEDKQGVINIEGKWIIKPEKNRIISVISDTLFHIFETDNDSLSYFINLNNGEKFEKTNNGKSVKLIEISNEKYIIKYSSVSIPSIYKNIDIYKLNKEKITHIDSISNMVIPYASNGDIFVIKKEDKHYLYNLSKSEVLSKGFDDLTLGSISAYDNDYGFFIATQDDKKGIINQNGKWEINPIYHEILPFRGELALAQMNSLSFQYINKKGETIWELPETDKTAWNKEDFLKSFKNCEPSIYMEQQGRGTVYEYEIKPDVEDGGGCVVQSKFIFNPNPEWIGKTMSCTYDNSLSFQQAIQPCLPNSDENHCNCEGELWSIMSK